MIINTALKEDANFRKGVVGCDDVMQVGVPFATDVGKRDGVCREGNSRSCGSFGVDYGLLGDR